MSVNAIALKTLTEIMTVHVCSLSIMLCKKLKSCKNVEKRSLKCILLLEQQIRK